METRREVLRVLSEKNHVLKAFVVFLHTGMFSLRLFSSVVFCNVCMEPRGIHYIYSDPTDPFVCAHITGYCCKFRFFSLLFGWSSVNQKLSSQVFCWTPFPHTSAYLIRNNGGRTSNGTYCSWIYDLNWLLRWFLLCYKSKCCSRHCLQDIK